jgi:hypothetical protein
MTQDQDPTPEQQLPEDFQEYVDARFGFGVAMPKRFEILPETIDPLARMMRGLNELSDEEAAKLQPRLPIGFFDPDVLGELEDGAMQPLRLFEYDALRGREEPLTDEQTARMWTEIQDFMPETLASAQMPGFEFLETRETALGPFAALAFEYHWDGVRPGFFGGDHACVVWALGPMTMYHVYHHCSAEEWEARRPELDTILGSFRLLEEGEGAPPEGASPSGEEAPQSRGEAPPSEG